MPFRVYFQSALLIIIGLVICYLLRRRWVFLLLFLGIVVGVCGLLLPCFPLFGNAFCEGNSRKKIIALTFDDGPNEPYTSQILSILEKYKIHATFFILGENAQRLPDSVVQIVAAGNVVGNHTMDHAPLVFKTREEILGEIEKWEKVTLPLIPSPQGRGSFLLFRAPHGWKSPFLSSVLQQKGYRLIGWTRGVWDTDRPGIDILLSRVVSHPENGMILLLHDGEDIKVGGDRSQTVAVLPRIIDTYQQLGYRFVTIPEMLKFSE